VIKLNKNGEYDELGKTDIGTHTPGDKLIATLVVIFFKVPKHGILGTVGPSSNFAPAQ
jgi:hypothetical protein